MVGRDIRSAVIAAAVSAAGAGGAVTQERLIAAIDNLRRAQTEKEFV